jgi:hypothetical protein
VNRVLPVFGLNYALAAVAFCLAAAVVYNAKSLEPYLENSIVTLWRSGPEFTIIYVAPSFAKTAGLKSGKGALTRQLQCKKQREKGRT